MFIITRIINWILYYSNFELAFARSFSVELGE